MILGEVSYDIMMDKARCFRGIRVPLVPSFDVQESIEVI